MDKKEKFCRKCWEAAYKDPIKSWVEELERHQNYLNTIIFFVKHPERVDFHDNCEIEAKYKN